MQSWSRGGGTMPGSSATRKASGPIYRRSTACRKPANDAREKDSPMSATHRAVSRTARIAAFSRNAAFLSYVIVLAACGRAGVSGSAASDAIKPGTYRVVLQLPGGELPFGLDLQREGSGGWVGHLINGPERLELREVTVGGSHLEIKMPGYENHLTADAQGGELQGELVLIKPEGKDQHIPL